MWRGAVLTELLTVTLLRRLRRVTLGAGDADVRVCCAAECGAMLLLWRSAVLTVLLTVRLL